jgi:hypothetical protein
MTALHLHCVEHGNIPFGHGHFHLCILPNEIRSSIKMTLHVGGRAQPNHNMKHLAARFHTYCKMNKAGT